MRLGLHALGIGAGSTRAVIDAVAVAAEQSGFATLWSGEHVVMVDRSSSRYPYSDDGQIAVPAEADWIDPLIGLGFAAAATSTIGIATGVLLLPEHNPVLVAKQAATLDMLSGGRLTLGVGVGWSLEEIDAHGVPFARRAARTAEYVAAMRSLWRDDVATFHGEFVSFDSVRVNPKPVADRRIPIVLGGNSDAALGRVVGWATAGTGSTWMACAKSRNESASLIGSAPSRDATALNCGWPWRSAICRWTMSARSTTSASTNWSSSTVRRPTPVRPRTGCRRWPRSGSSVSRPGKRETTRGRISAVASAGND
jgi:probable F420-dependent oxidoreductase